MKKFTQRPVIFVILGIGLLVLLIIITLRLSGFFDSKGLIAFIAYEDNKGEILVANLSDQKINKLIDREDISVQAATDWSPDGKRIAFVANTGPKRIGASPLEGSERYFELYTMNQDGTDITNISNNSASCDIIDPEWSPSKTQIAFASDCDIGWDVYIMNADGTNKQELTVDETLTWDGEPSWSPMGDKLAFSSTRDGNPEIYLYDFKTKEFKDFTNNPAGDQYPAWSPDGKWIAFETERSGEKEIYAQSLDNGELVNLTNSISIDMEPAWSSDGKYLAFVSDRRGQFDLYVLEIESGEVNRVTNTSGFYGFPDWYPTSKSPSNDLAQSLSKYSITEKKDSNPPKMGLVVYSCDQEACLLDLATDQLTKIELPNTDLNSINGNSEPALAPDGNTLAFVCTDPITKNKDICLLNIRSKQTHNLTNHVASDTSPAWSADGEHIAFVSDREGNDEIYTVQIDGTDLTRITNYWGDDQFPAWSPDGKWIATQAFYEGNWEILAFELNSGKIVNLTNSSTEDKGPAWSPDGTYIAFNSLRETNPQRGKFDEELFALDLQTGQIKRLTGHSAADLFPVWSPDGMHIMFNRETAVNNRLGNQFYTIKIDGKDLAIVDLKVDYPPDRLQWWGASSTNVITQVDISLPSVVPTPEVFPTPIPELIGKGRIVFSSNRDGNDEIYIMNADGTGLHRLTHDPRSDWDISWSGDSDYIIFKRGPRNDYEILEMNIENGNIRPIISLDKFAELTNSSRDSSFIWLGWSAGGDMVFLDTTVSPDDHFKSINMITQKENEVVKISDEYAGTNLSVALSPDRKWVAYSHVEPGILEDYGDDKSYLRKTSLVNSETITLTQSWIDNLAWSPNGKKIAFNSGATDVIIVDAESGSTKTLKNAIASISGDVVWSPNSEWIALVGGSSDDVGLDGMPKNNHIKIIRADGSEIRDLAKDVLASDYNPYSLTWSPDSQWIAFSNSVVQYSDINAVNINSEAVLTLTNHLADDREPSWGP